MTLIQIFIILFALFAISRTVLQFRRGALSLAWFMLWVLFWVLVAGVVFAPQTTDVLASFVGVGRGADVIIYFSIIALLYIVFRLFIKLEDVEQELTKLVRSLAIKESEGPDSKQNK